MKKLDRQTLHRCLLRGPSSSVNYIEPRFKGSPYFGDFLPLGNRNCWYLGHSSLGEASESSPL
jgi:hypothetical protein